MSYLGQRILALRESDDSLVVNQQPVGVLNLEVVRVGRFQLDNTAALRVCENLVEREPEQYFLVL